MLRESLSPLESAALRPQDFKTWSASAPDRVRAAYTLDATDGWAAWSRHIIRRKRPRPLHRLLGGRRSALAWAVRTPELETAERAIELLDELTRSNQASKFFIGDVRKLANQWLADFPTGDPPEAYGLVGLAWCGALPQLVRVLRPDEWWRLVEHLFALANESAGIELERQPLARQLMASELPITLAYVLPELATTEPLARTGREVLTGAMAELLDGEGLIQGRHLAAMRPLWASWTRSIAMLRELDLELDERTAEEYRYLLDNAMRLRRADGSQALGTRSAGRKTRGLFKAAEKIAGVRIAKRFRKTTGRKPGKKALPKEEAKFPAPGNHSPWAEMSILRSDWSAKSSTFTIAYNQPQVMIELSTGGETLWSGVWGLEVRLNGVPMTITDRWEETCWVSDADVDYCEIEARLTGNLRVQRQCMLARKEGILFLADAVLGREPANIETRSVLPTIDKSHFAPAAETVEGVLAAHKAKARLLPLGLSEWRSNGRSGQLTMGERCLELRQQARGTALLAPLLIDLDKKRLDEQLTWRHLSIAERRELQPADIAVGYRAQIGTRQWLFYRSLAPPAARTVLGQNLSTEFLAARFKQEGETDILVEIEPA